MMKNGIGVTFLFSFLACILSSCQPANHFREGKFFAGGKYVDAKTLNLGQTTYMEYCFACHGVKGDGMGVAAKGLYPPVRNFKQGIFKFGEVYDGELPHDDTMVKLLKKGLNGSAMLPWDISDQRAYAVVQYIKTFAPEVWEGKDKKLGKKVAPELMTDPYGIARREMAIEKGKEVYHFVANCQSCHRGYVSLEEYNVLAKKTGDETVSELDEDFYQLKPQDSDYGAKMIPPDFTWHPVRSAQSVEELAIRIGAGVGGVMPTWKDVITDAELWAVAYYVKSLMELKDSPKRKNLVGNR